MRDQVAVVWRATPWASKRWPKDLRTRRPRALLTIRIASPALCRRSDGALRYRANKLRRCARCIACGHKGATIQHPGRWTFSEPAAHWSSQFATLLRLHPGSLDYLCA